MTESEFSSHRTRKGGLMSAEKIRKKALTPIDVETIYGIPRGSLANMRWAKTGPKYYKVGSRRVMYLVNDVEEWITRSPIQTKDSIENGQWN